MGGEPLAALPGQLSEKLAASELDSGSMTRKKKWQAAAQSDMLGLSSFSFDGADSDKWSDLTSSVLHSMPKEPENDCGAFQLIRQGFIGKGGEERVQEDI